MKKVLSIGIDDFKELLDGNNYYIDKSKLICNLIDTNNKATLITRPRRFGKSLNMSMLRYFFEKSKKDNGYLFDGLEVSKDERYMKEQGKYPVISISFSIVKAQTFEETLKIFSKIVSKLFEYHQESINFNSLTSRERKQWSIYTDGTIDNVDLSDSLLFLSECLEKSYQEKVIILIDEYDVPLDNAYFNGFYDQMINFIRILFGSVIKGNSSSKMSILTGCLRISKESIFTGMNNLVVYSVIDKPYSQYYGFTEQEVQQLLEYYGLENKFKDIKKWYDGYLYGNQEIYNPWSVLNYVKNLIEDSTIEPTAYWSNSSSNSIIHKLIVESSVEIKNDIESLINDETLIKPLYENMTYKEMETNKPTIWSFLLHTGYLKLLKSFRNESNTQLMGNFAIPNFEILTIFNTEIQNWISDILRKNDNTYILNDMLTQQPKLLEQHINDWLYKTISYHDTKERESFYHGLLLGMFSNFENFKVISNRESGDGRFDIVLKDYQYNTAIILELKVADTKKDLITESNKALNQIENNHYDIDLLNEGYSNILKFGIAFFKKICMVIS